MVLDSLMTDIETLDTMRSCGDARPYGVALAEEDRIIDAVRELLAKDLIEALDDGPDDGYTGVSDAGTQDAASLRRYWYRPTAAGHQAWVDGGDLLDAYWDEHPITFSPAVRLKSLWRRFRWRLPF
jgi:hypothetical protein